MNIQAAINFAAAAHKGQYRKQMGADDRLIPYIVHPVGVAAYVAANGGSRIAMVAALLHDTVEDTAVTLADIEARFGARVAEVVDALTRRDGEPYNDYVRRAAADDDAAIVKRYDITHNRKSLPAGHSLHVRYDGALAILDGTSR